VLTAYCVGALAQLCTTSACLADPAACRKTAAAVRKDTGQVHETIPDLVVRGRHNVTAVHSCRRSS
jgi:hypothetical protein